MDLKKAHTLSRSNRGKRGGGCAKAKQTIKRLLDRNPGRQSVDYHLDQHDQHLRHEYELWVLALVSKLASPVGRPSEHARHGGTSEVKFIAKQFEIMQKAE